MASHQFRGIGLVTILLAVVPLSQGAPQISTAQVAQENRNYCPIVRGAPNFSLSRFQGVWFVGHHFHLQPPPCQAIRIDVANDGRLIMNTRMVMSRNTSFTASGQGVAPFPENPGAMFWSWNYSPLAIEEVTVVETDYETYAILVFCLILDTETRKGAVVLSREATIDSTYVTRARQVLSPYFNLPSGSITRQQECLNEVDSNMQELNLDTMFRNLVQVVSSFTTLRLGTFVTPKN